MECAPGLIWNLQNKANGGGGEQDRNGVLRECACLSVRERERGGGDMQYKLDCVFFFFTVLPVFGLHHHPTRCWLILLFSVQQL